MSELEEWLLLNREWLQRQALAALDDLTAYFLAQHHWEKARQYAQRQLEIDRLRETAYQQLMQIELAHGDRTAAMHHYQQCQTILLDEMGVEPAGDTAALYDSIKNATVPTTLEAILPPTELPTFGTGFFGRNHELATLLNYLASPPHRLVTIVGVGGVGKTRLASLTASECRGMFPDGIWFVPLAHLASSDEQLHDDLVDNIAAVLQLRFADTPSPQQQLLDHLRPKQALLILDNLEHLNLALVRQLVFTLLDGAPSLKVLATSRERLRSQRETLLKLDGLRVPSHDIEEDWETFAAVQLFAERARRTASDVRLNQTTRPAIIDICQQVSGLPLGIELAATWVEHYTLEEIAHGVRTDNDFLRATQTMFEERHDSLRVVFERSWQSLSPESQQLLAQLSVFAVDFGREAILQICSVSMHRLIDLVDKSLVQVVGSGRYVLHALVKRFSAEKHALLPDNPAFKHRFSGYYLNLIAEQQTTLYGHGLSSTVTSLLNELPNITQAWQWAIVQEQFDLLQTSTNAIARLCNLTSRFRTASQLFLPAIESLRTYRIHQDTPQLHTFQAQLLVEQAACLNRLNAFSEAIAFARQALTFGGSALISAAAGLQLGTAYWHQWALQDAQTHFERACEWIEQYDAKDTDDARWQRDQILVDILLGLGTNAYRMGQYADSQPFYKRALTLCRERRDQHGESKALQNLAAIARNLGEHEQALRYYTASLAVAKALSNRRDLMRIAYNLGDVVYYQGHYDEARRHYEYSLQIAQAVGDQIAQGIAINNLGTLARTLGAYDEAQAHFLEALRLHETRPFQRGMAWSLSNLGLLHHLLDLHQQAVDYARRGVALFEAIDDRVGQSYGNTYLGHALLGANNLDDAQTAYQRASLLIQEIGHRYLLMEAFAGSAEIALQKGDYNQAVAYAESILSYLENYALNGSYRPYYIMWTCYRVLLKSAPIAAQNILEDAASELTERAEQLQSVETRQRFLNKKINKHLIELSSLNHPSA